MGVTAKRSYSTYCIDIDAHGDSFRKPISPPLEPLFNPLFVINPISNHTSLRPSRASSSSPRSRDTSEIYAQNYADEEPHRTHLPLLHRSTSLPALSKLQSIPLVAPLTRQNLLRADRTNTERAMDPRLIGAPVTPQKSVSSAQGWDTPSLASSSSSSTDAGAKLELINLFGPETSEPILQSLPDFQEHILAIVNGGRASAMKPESRTKFRRDFNDVKSRNEATLHERIMPHLIKDGRTVFGEGAEDVYREFREDGLDRNVDADFSTGSVPIPRLHASEKNLERMFGVKNPKPDYTFGFRPSILTPEEQLLLRRYDTTYSLSKGVLSPFFIMEWKGVQGTMQECSVQARRGGAAMVNARRQLRASTISDYNFCAPDLATAAFSCAMTSDIAYVAVHWCQRVGDTDCWYMAIVRRFFVAEIEDIQKLRLTLHNIIDWGLLERQRSVREELAVLNERWKLAKAQESEAQDEVPSSKRRRNR
ncbi:hypothetical protein D0Z07_9391 [Hyphodiscus hymeniophilus]|uniref:DUF7924 domain-containing protein n=1 Tax=Hyphodiscus hymeniophilus TaxID=353542 RepID=A0A9P7B1A9_9HELO|nr:hypothetical protein D0Z07_9391 [Hyphodiscus hymeniophilus]